MGYFTFLLLLRQVNIRINGLVMCVSAGIHDSKILDSLLRGNDVGGAGMTDRRDACPTGGFLFFMFLLE